MKITIKPRTEDVDVLMTVHSVVMIAGFCFDM